MKTKGTSSVSSRSSRKPSVRKTTELGDSIVRGLQEGIAHARGELKLKSRRIHVGDAIDVHLIREKLGLSQADFASKYRFNLVALRQWEDGIAEPDAAIRAYLLVIDRNPAAVEDALKRAS